VSDKNIKFYQLLEITLNDVLQKTIKSSEQKEINHILMREIRVGINESISSVFSKSKYKLSQEAIMWLSDQYFKRIKISKDQTMSDQVVINEYTLSELTFDDIQLLRNLFIETQMGLELDNELRKRSLS
jgi:hypothetical protein